MAENFTINLVGPIFEGTSFNLSLKKEDCVGDVKKKLADLGFPSGEYLSLIVSGKEAEDTDILYKLPNAGKNSVNLTLQGKNITVASFSDIFKPISEPAYCFLSHYEKSLKEKDPLLADVFEYAGNFISSFSGEQTAKKEIIESIEPNALPPFPTLSTKEDVLKTKNDQGLKQKLDELLGSIPSDLGQSKAKPLVELIRNNLLDLRNRMAVDSSFVFQAAAFIIRFITNLRELGMDLFQIKEFVEKLSEKESNLTAKREDYLVKKKQWENVKGESLNQENKAEFDQLCSAQIDLIKAFIECQDICKVNEENNCFFLPKKSEIEQLENDLKEIQDIIIKCQIECQEDYETIQKYRDEVLRFKEETLKRLEKEKTKLQKEIDQIDRNRKLAVFKTVHTLVTEGLSAIHKAKNLKRIGNITNEENRFQEETISKIEETDSKLSEYRVFESELQSSSLYLEEVKFKISKAEEETNKLIAQRKADHFEGLRTYTEETWLLSSEAYRDSFEAQSIFSEQLEILEKEKERIKKKKTEAKFIPSLLKECDEKINEFEKNKEELIHSYDKYTTDLELLDVYMHKTLNRWVRAYELEVEIEGVERVSLSSMKSSIFEIGNSKVAHPILELTEKQDKQRLESLTQRKKEKEEREEQLKQEIQMRESLMKSRAKPELLRISSPSDSLRSSYSSS